MKKIEAIIKPFKLSEVKNALHEIGLSGMTIIEVKGFGRQRGLDDTDKNHNNNNEFLAKIMIEIIVEDENSEIHLKSYSTIYLLPFFFRIHKVCT